MGFKDTSKYQDKKQNKPSFMDTAKYQFMDTSKYQNEEKPKPKVVKVDTSRPSMVSGGRPMINFDAKKLDKSAGVVAPFAAGLSNVAGITEAIGLNNEYVKENPNKRFTTVNSRGIPVSLQLPDITPYAIGNLGSMGATGGLISKGVKPITKAVEKKLTRTIAKKVVPQSIDTVAQATGFTVPQDIIKGKDAKEILKDTAINTAMFTGMNVGLKGLGKLGKTVTKQVEVPKVVETPKVVEVPKTNKKIQTTLSGSKFKVNNPQYEKAMSNYNDAIETIQNHYGHFQLTPEETLDVLRNSKQKFGFDFKGILKDMSKYENKLNLKEISNRQNQKYVYGVENRITPKLKQPNIKTESSKPIEYNSTSDVPTPIAEVENQTPTNKTSMFSRFYNRIVDSKNPTKLIDKNLHMMATNSTNAPNIANQIVHDGLRDSKTGDVIGKSLKELADLYPKGKEAEFEKYMRFRHNVGRGQQGKNIYSDFTPEQSIQAYKAFEKENPTWKAKADEIINWVDSFQKEWAVKTGITSEDLYKSLREMYPDYIPTNRVFTDLEGGIVKQGGKGFVDQTIPMSKATGSDRNLTPTMENLINIVNRTVKTAKYNEVGQTLLKSIREKPSIYAEIIPEGTKINPNVNNVVSVLEGGKPINIQINDKSLLDALQGMTKQKGPIEETARKVTNIYTGLITHKNPLFALKNLARDIPTAYVNGTEKNPITFLKDLGVAGKDIVGNTKINQQYKGLGGGGSNFMAGNAEKTAQTLNKNPNIIKKALGGIENFNSLMESAPRLAEFKRVLSKTNDVQKALYAANDVTVNFSRGGDITKTINSIVPFSNASVQGLDRLARSLDPRNPAKMAGTLIKGGIAITAPTMFFDYINKDNENYKALDNRTKDNYYVFYYGKGSGDSIKLPKTRELGVLFGSLFERLHRQNQGEKDAFKGFANTARTNFAPTNPFENNVFTPIVTAIPSNKDFANRDIVPRWMKDQNLSPKYQYDEKTTELAKKIGEAANISPKQIDYIMKSYLGVIAQIGQPLLTKGGKPLDAITSSYKADSKYSNQALTDFYDNLDKLKQDAADNNFVNNIPSSRLTKEEAIRGQFTKAQTKISDINKKIKNTTDKEEINKLRQAIIDIAKTSNDRLK